MNNNTAYNNEQENKENTVIGSPLEWSFYRSTPVRLYLLALLVYMICFWASAMLADFQGMDFIVNTAIAVCFVMPIPSIITSRRIGKHITTHRNRWLTIPFVYVVTAVATMLTGGVGGLLLGYHGIRTSMIMAYVFILPIPCAVFSFVGLMDGIIESGGLVGMVKWLRVLVMTYTFWFGVLALVGGWTHGMEGLSYDSLGNMLFYINPIFDALPRAWRTFLRESLIIGDIRPLIVVTGVLCWVALGLMIDIPNYFLRQLRKPERSVYGVCGAFLSFAVLFVITFWLDFHLFALLPLVLLFVLVPISGAYLAFDVGKSSLALPLKLSIVPLTALVTSLCITATIAIDRSIDFMGFGVYRWDGTFSFYPEDGYLLLYVVVLSTVGVLCGVYGKEMLTKVLNVATRTFTFWFFCLVTIEVLTTVVDIGHHMTSFLWPFWYDEARRFIRLTASSEFAFNMMYIAFVTVCGAVIDALRLLVKHIKEG